MSTPPDGYTPLMQMFVFDGLPMLLGPMRSDGVDEFDKQLSGGKPFEEFEKEFFTSVRPSSLLKRFATTEEVANLAAYISSPLSSATNGAA
jgi:hypothetical protein